jgi:hypothetical protein
LQDDLETNGTHLQDSRIKLDGTIALIPLPSPINPVLCIDADDHPLVATDAIHNHYATSRTVIVASEGQFHSLITESPRYLKYPAFGTTILHGTLDDLFTTRNTLS